MKFSLTYLLAMVWLPMALTAAPKQQAEKARLSPSERIDQLVEAGYKERGVEPNPIASDEIFLRRVYLDIMGRVPTKAEAVAFLEDKAKNKRTKLVNELLDSDGYISHTYNYWADLLRIKTQLAGAGNSQAAGYAYQDWVRGAIEQNMPYDQMVQELITASGKTWENGAVGYYIRDFGMNLDNLAMTSQLFLGTQIVCAQCHDHPFDQWSQMDYYKMAAFTYGMQTSNQYPNAKDAIQHYRRKMKASPKEARDLNRAFSEILKPVRFNNVFEVDRSLRLPHDYQYADAKPKSVVAPDVPFGDLTPVKKGEMPIHSFAEWLTSPENERFTTVIANRLWKRGMGVGLIEPVDDFREGTEASNPKLMKFLETYMVNSGYDMKKFMRAIYLSNTYQREASAVEVLPGMKYHFPGPVLRRMSAEQLWDSLITMIVEDVDAEDLGSALRRDRLVARVEWTAMGVYDLTPEEMVEVGLEIAEVQQKLASELQRTQLAVAEARDSGDVEQLRAAQKEGNLIRRQLDEEIAERVYKRGLSQKSMLLASNKEVGSNPFWGELEEVMESNGDLIDGRGDTMAGGMRSKKDVGYGGSDYIEDLVDAALQPQITAYMEQQEERRNREKKAWDVRDTKEKTIYRNFDRARRGYVRASDMRSPAPNGHFLREFGQSDRELIENANDQASITQALALLNGTISNGLMSKYSVITRELYDAKTPMERLDAVYLTMLNRYPTNEERRTLLPIVQEGGVAGAHRVVWTLLNTRQFIFIQ